MIMVARSIGIEFSANGGRGEGLDNVKLLFGRWVDEKQKRMTSSRCM